MRRAARRPGRPTSAMRCSQLSSTISKRRCSMNSISSARSRSARRAAVRARARARAPIRRRPASESSSTTQAPEYSASTSPRGGARAWSCPRRPARRRSTGATPESASRDCLELDPAADERRGLSRQVAGPRAGTRGESLRAPSGRRRSRRPAPRSSCIGELAGRGVASVRRLGQRPGDHDVDGPGRVAAHLGQRWRRGVKVGEQVPGVVFACVRRSVRRGRGRRARPARRRRSGRRRARRAAARAPRRPGCPPRRRRRRPTRRPARWRGRSRRGSSARAPARGAPPSRCSGLTSLWTSPLACGRVEPAGDLPDEREDALDGQRPVRRR